MSPTPNGGKRPPSPALKFTFKRQHATPQSTRDPRTLRAAVLDCTDERCLGFAWKTQQGTNDLSDLYEASPDTKFEVVFCKTTAVATETGWNMVLKANTALVVSPTVAAIKSSMPFSSTNANAAFQTATMVSFQSKTSDTTASIPAGFQLGVNFFVDEGKVYGARGNGQKYGWNCAQTESMDNGFKPQTPPTVWSTSVTMKTKCAGPGSGELPTLRRKSRFSFQVPNGVYSVMTYHGADSADRHIDSKNRGCTVENVAVGEASAGTQARFDVNNVAGGVGIDNAPTNT